MARGRDPPAGAVQHGGCALQQDTRLAHLIILLQPIPQPHLPQVADRGVTIPFFSGIGIESILESIPVPELIAIQ